MTEVREFDLEPDYAMIRSWWDARGYLTPPPTWMLPPNGIVIAVDDRPVAAGFVIQSDAGVATLGHLVSDPGAPGAVRNDALDALIPALVDRAKKLGFHVISAAGTKPSLIQRYQKFGFLVSEAGVTIIGRVI